jgi:hypothetical protein
MLYLKRTHTFHTIYMAHQKSQQIKIDWTMDMKLLACIAECEMEWSEVECGCKRKWK